MRSERPRWRRCCGALLLVCVLCGPVAADPKRVDGHVKAGRAALEDGLSPLAARLFERALEERGIRPDQKAEALTGLARALHEQGRHDLILERLKPGGPNFQQVPDQASFHFWRAMACHEKGLHDAALADVAVGLERFPGDTVYGGRLQRLQAWCYLKKGEADRAFEVFAAYDKAVQDASERLENLLEWAKALMAEKRIDKAAEVLEQVLAFPSDDPCVQEGRYWMGSVLIEQEKWTEAAVVLKEMGANTNVTADLRSRALSSLATALGESGGSQEDVLAALEQGMKVARDPELKRQVGFRLGRKLLDKANLDEGIPLLKQLIAEDPEDPEAGEVQLTLAYALLNHGQYSEAAVEFQHHLETFTNHVGQARAYEGKGWGLVRTGRQAEAAVAFSKAHSLFDDPRRKAQALFKMADAYFANSQFALAADAYRQLLKEFAVSPFVPRAAFQLGESLARSGEATLASVQFERLCDAYPEDPVAEEGLLRIAELKEGQKEWAAAIDGFNRVMTTYTNGVFYADALHGRAMVRYRLYRYNKARDDFKRVAEAFPKSGVVEHAHHMWGLCEYWLERDEAALLVWRRFVKQLPDSIVTPDVMFWIGKCEHNRGNFEAAERDFLLFVGRYPLHPLAEHALYRAGLSASWRKEYVHAIELFTRLAKEYPESELMPEVRFAQADALIELAKFSSAILVLEAIVNKYPDRYWVAQAWGRKGDCQFSLGTGDVKRFKESIESYRVVVTRPDAGRDLVLQAACKIGRALEMLKKKDEALEQYYVHVVVPYFEDVEQGTWHNATAKLWFTRAAFYMADIFEAREEWTKVVSILERVVEAAVPAASEALERIRKIKAEHWWLFPSE